MVGWWASGQEIVMHVSPHGVDGKGMETGVGGAHQILPPNSNWVVTYIQSMKTNVTAFDKSCDGGEANHTAMPWYCNLQDSACGIQPVDMSCQKTSWLS